MNGRSLRNGSFKRAAATSALTAVLLAGMPLADDAAGETQVSPTSADGTRPEAVEKTMRQGLSALIDDHAALSLKHTRSLLKRQPNFQLGQLIHADLLAARAHQNTLMATSGALKKTRIRGLIEEAQARAHYREPPDEHLPGAIMQLSQLHRHALIVDAENSRLYLLENKNGVPEPAADYYISTGNGGVGKTSEGDEKTPLGVYHPTLRLNDSELPELYGVGAYPLNYPNKWDQLNQRDGSGIWLHGTPRKVYSRPPKDSRGCIVLSNRLLTSLSSYIEVGRTPVILTRKIEWLKPDAWQAKRGQLLDAIQQWQRDWQSLDVEQYLAHYSRNYRTSKQNYEQMTAVTRRNAAKKTFVKVGIKDLDLFDYPEETGIVVAAFDQDYRSNNYNIHYRKQQFWKYENDRWMIIFEGRAG